MIQIQIFRDCGQGDVNHWLREHQDKNIIDIKQCCGEYPSRNSIMIIYEEPNEMKITNSPLYEHCL